MPTLVPLPRLKPTPADRVSVTPDDILHEGSSPAWCSCTSCVLARVDGYAEVHRKYRERKAVLGGFGAEV